MYIIRLHQCIYKVYSASAKKGRAEHVITAARGCVTLQQTGLRVLTPTRIHLHAARLPTANMTMRDGEEHHLHAAG